jgi:predicted helicase
VAARRARQIEHHLHYFRLPETWRKEEKLKWLLDRGNITNVQWKSLPCGRWLSLGKKEFETFIPLGSKQARAAGTDPETIFKLYSLGVSTNRDDVVYGFDNGSLQDRVREFCEAYNAEVDRYKRSGKVAEGVALDRFLDYSKVKWSRDLKKDLRRGRYAEFDEESIRSALYRPFTKRFLYLADLLNDTPGLSRSFFPDEGAEGKNKAFVVTSYGSEKPFMVLAVNRVSDLYLVGAGCGSESFPFYAYESDGETHHENITDWALDHFRNHYGDAKITKWDIFYYVYGVLHHPQYRAKYAENLKRELPRIPLAKDFRAFANAGKELAQLHIDYERLEPYPLKFLENKELPLSYRVEDKMRLSKDRKSLKVNDSLTLAGIPPETFEYRLGNRSALEWVIDQYQVTEDKRSGIRSDPNRTDDPEYTVRLVGQVVRVSLETVRIAGTINALPLE